MTSVSLCVYNRTPLSTLKIAHSHGSSGPPFIIHGSLGTPESLTYKRHPVSTAREHGRHFRHPCSRAVETAREHGPWTRAVCIELNSATCCQITGWQNQGSIGSNIIKTKWKHAVKTNTMRHYVRVFLEIAHISYCSFVPCYSSLAVSDALEPRWQ